MLNFTVQSIIEHIVLAAYLIYSLLVDFLLNCLRNLESFSLILGGFIILETSSCYTCLQTICNMFCSWMLPFCWQEHPECQITGETFTTDHHEELIKMGIHPTLKGVKRDHKFPYVIFCAPPSRSSDYASDVG